MKAVILTAALLAAGFLASGLFTDLTEGEDAHVTYWRTGAQKSSVSMQDGVRWGLATEWYSDGTKESEGSYIDGLREGEWSFWRKDGSQDGDRSGSYLVGRRVTSVAAAE